MDNVKLRLSLCIPGAQLLSSQECEKNPEENYDEQKVLIKYTKGKGKNLKESTKVLTIKTRKQRLVRQNITMCDEAFKYMIDTPTTPKLAKPIKHNKHGEVIERVWDKLTLHEKLKHHFDQIAHDFRAVSYSYEILDD